MSEKFCPMDKATQAQMARVMLEVGTDEQKKQAVDWLAGKNTIETPTQEELHCPYK